ncbi:MAG: thiosulfate oxidation carrier complex protein SoxZ [Betaproteobacteria bacterium]
MSNALVTVPATAKRGEIVEIKTLVSHNMETGYRRTERGAPIQRDIVRTFSCTYNGVEVFSAELHPAISANPYIAFSTRATETGQLVFTWKGDNGFVATSTATLTVS